MPFCASASPATVTVRSPVTKVSASSGIGVGLQRNWPSGRSVSSRSGAVRIEALVDALEAAGVPHRRADAIEPGALVGRLRRGERRAGKLLGIKAVIDLLRRIAAHRQRARQRLGLEACSRSPTCRPRPSQCSQSDNTDERILVSNETDRRSALSHAAATGKVAILRFDPDVSRLASVASASGSLAPRSVQKQKPAATGNGAANGAKIEMDSGPSEDGVPRKHRLRKRPRPLRCKLESSFPTG